MKGRCGRLQLLHMAIGASVLFGWACDRRPADKAPVLEELETEEVGAALDAELSTELDQQGRRRVAAVAGVLPEGFPADLPLPAPSSVVDLGELEGGRRFVELDASPSPAQLGRDLAVRLQAAGWRRAGSGSGAEGEYVKGDRRVVLRLEDLAPGTRLRVEYRPRR